MSKKLLSSLPLTTGRFIAVFTVTALAQTVPRQEPQLSPAQSAIIQQKIATLHAAGERNIARSWSNAKKVGEVICRPEALTTLKKKNPAIDKVFLGTSDPASLALESNERLTGTGQYRIGHQWTNFTFTCDLNPKNGKASGFQIVPLPAKQ